MPNGEPRLILTLSCLDQAGIVAAVSGAVRDAGGWIVESANYADRQTERFFMREEILQRSLKEGTDDLRERIGAMARSFDMQWQLRSTEERKRVVVMVGKQEHCLYDLLGRVRAGELNGDIVAVLSNHNDLRDVTEAHGVDFVHIADVNGPELPEVLSTRAADVVVLARYMQVIPEELCRRFQARMINIHHGFLPSFKGAKPYHQAHHRGVKLIGATCHYVTDDLDEGPIIEQDVVRIDHSDSIESLTQNGKDIEKAVLARGLRWHLEDRVLLNGDRTVVFR